MCILSHYRQTTITGWVGSWTSSVRKWVSTCWKGPSVLPPTSRRRWIFDLVRSHLEQERILLEPCPEAKKTHGGRVRQSEAGQQRLKTLLAKGIPLKTAQSLAVKMSNAPYDIQTTPKKARSDGSTPTTSSMPTKRFSLAGNKKVDNSSTVSAASLSSCNLMNGVKTPSKGSAGPGKRISMVFKEQASRSASSEIPCSRPTLTATVASKKIGTIPHDVPEGIWSTEKICKV